MPNNTMFKGDKALGQLFSRIGTQNKTVTFETLIAYMLNRTARMFKYDGLPETVNARALEMYLQMGGYAFITDKYNGELYAYFGGYGGRRDEYYRPTLAIIANPAQNFSGSFEIGKDAEVIYNDTFLIGLTPMFNRYAELLTENLLSIKKQFVNSRKTALITAATDNQKDAVERFLKQLEDGRDSVVTDNNFVQGIQVQPLNANPNQRQFTELIETYQFLLGQWYGELGIETAFNLKREAIGDSESELANNALTALTNDMLQCRREGLERINTHYGTNITVQFNSTWEEQAEKKDTSDTEKDTSENMGVQ